MSEVSNGFLSPTSGGFAPIQVQLSVRVFPPLFPSNLTESPLSDLAENAVSFPYQLIIATLAGFPLALIVAWAFELMQAGQSGVI